MSILTDELALPAYSGISDEAAAAALNDKTIAALQPIQSFEIRRYLMLNGLWLAVKRSGSDAAEVARDALEEFGQFDINDPLVLGALTNILDGLVAEVTTPDFTASHKADILAMGDTMISRAEELGIRVTTADVQKARGSI